MANSSGRRSWHWFINVIAFVAFALIGLVLLLDVVNIGGGILAHIGYALAFIVVGACSFAYVSTKFRRKRWWIYVIIWAAAAVLVTIVFIIPLVRTLTS